MTDEREEHPLLRVRDLKVSFDGSAERVRAVDGASFTVYPNQTLAVVGESGCGKSVSALSVLRLIPSPPGRLDGGELLFRRRSGEVTDLASAEQKVVRSIRGNEIAMIFQEPMTSLNPVERVGDQIMEAVLLHRAMPAREARGIAIARMEEVGIRDAAGRFGQYPHQFSGGMRQRVMIAMALACEPRLLLADEPTTALDVTIQAQILELLRGLREQRGLGIVLITHDMGVVAQNADVVCVMYGGRVVEYARVEELFARPLHPYTRGLLACIPGRDESARRERLKTVMELTADPAGMRVPVGGGLAAYAWWPHHAQADTSGGYVLSQVEPGRWVGLWRTPEAATVGESAPDLAYRRVRRRSEVSAPASV